LTRSTKEKAGSFKATSIPSALISSNGVVVAVGSPTGRPNLGKDERTIKDATGDAFGQRVYDAAKEEQINEVSYKFPKPGPDRTPMPKVSFVTAVAGLGCGVGYYK
jgi:hypothetical protein